MIKVFLHTIKSNLIYCISHCRINRVYSRPRNSTFQSQKFGACSCYVYSLSIIHIQETSSACSCFWINKLSWVIYEDNGQLGIQVKASTIACEGFRTSKGARSSQNEWKSSSSGVLNKEEPSINVGNWILTNNCSSCKYIVWV